MATDYMPRDFFRRVPNALLREYFSRSGLLAGVGWDALKESDAESIYAAWQTLDEGMRAAIENDFQHVHELATSDGARTIIEEGQFHDKDLAADLDAQAGFHAKAMWTLLHEPTVFRVASQLDAADHLSGRYRRKRTGLPQRRPNLSAKARTALSDTVGAYFWNRQGRGRVCSMDVYLRGGRFDYFLIYPEDYAGTFVGYDDKAQLVRRPQKPAFEVVLVWDRTDGALTVWAPGNATVKQDLQAIFSEIMLDEILGPETTATAPYDLSQLKRREFAFATTPDDRISDVRLRSLRVAVRGNPRRRITLEADPKTSPDDVYDLMDQILGHGGLSLANVEPDHATIGVKFHPLDGRSKSVTIGISTNSCSLKDKPEDLVLAECLKRWKIARV